MKVLITGGAGYIGSVVVEELIKRNHKIVVIDNLCFGHREAIHPRATFVEGDLADRAAVKAAFDTHDFEAVMHFASHTLVGESMKYPFMFLGENVTNGLNLLQEAIEHDVRKFVLSSTANLFSNPEKMPISEAECVTPGSPYGESKYILERMLYWLSHTHGLRYTALRYFNAAGASKERGEDHYPETHLIPIVLQVALGQREQVVIHGDDYSTRDGTCVRDYIHVTDLAQAHILALNALDNGSCAYNLGNGYGFTIKEIIEAARRITGHPIPAVIGPRRPGDPAILIADSNKIKRELNWRPQFPDLYSIIETAWRWHSTYPKGYKK